MSNEFTCRQIRDVVRTRGHYLQAGAGPDNQIVEGLKRARDTYRADVGLSTYLSQMLGKCATEKMRFCALGWDDGRVLYGAGCTYPEWTAQRYIRTYYHNDLPFVVEVATENGTKAIFL